MSKKLTKEEVKKPDAFIHYTDKVIAWIEKHGKLVATLIAVFVIGGGSYVGFTKLQKHNEQKAQEALYEIRVELEKQTESFKQKEDAKADKKDQEKTQSAKTEKSESQEPEVKKEFAVHYADVIKKYQDFIETHPNTSARLSAFIQLAHLYVENEKYEEAETLLSTPVNEEKKDSFYYGLMAMLLSQVKMNLGKYEEALKILEVVSAQDSQKHLHAESLLRIGLCYENMKDLEKAKQYFERVTRDFEKSEAATHAKNFLRYLAIKENA